MIARNLNTGDILKDGSRWVVVGKVEFKGKTAMFVWGHDTNTNKKLCIKLSPNEDVEVL